MNIFHEQYFNIILVVQRKQYYYFVVEINSTWADIFQKMNDKYKMKKLYIYIYISYDSPHGRYR